MSESPAPPPSVERKAEPSGLRLTFTLGVAGLLSGLALVAVYELTLPRIQANKQRALKRAIFKVVPKSKTMTKLVPVKGVLTPVPASDKRAGVFAAYDREGHLIGYAILGEGPGFQDTIRLIYGYDARRQLIIGMEVLESRETPGLGDKIFKDAAFVGTFRALAVKPKVLVVKKGKRSKPHHVDAITGATISSKAVVKIINRANAKWLELLPAPGKEPASWRRAKPGKAK